jgi:alanyl-tRNA synthetase
MGTDRFEEMAGRLEASGAKILPGEEAFVLYDTYGFPLEMTEELVRLRGLSVDRDGFSRALEQQKERSRAGSQFGGDIFAADKLAVRQTIKDVPRKEEHFVGYDHLTLERARILGIWDGKRWVDTAKEGQQVAVVLDRSPFYGEAGGQIGDKGRLEGDSGSAAVEHTVWVDDALVHQARITAGALSVQQPVNARVDPDRRLQVARAHTAAHLLHWALRKVLGPEAMQAGSYVEAERVRFDFSSAKALHEEQRYQVEAQVNARVRLADAISSAQMRLAQAKLTGAIAMFGEKYGDHVRVVSIGDYSKELCGGTHLLHTGLIGTFKITSESSIAAGTRRIEALVGGAADDERQAQERVLAEASHRLSRPPRELVTAVDELLDKLKGLERERKAMQAELALVEAERLKGCGKMIGNATFISAEVKHADREQLKLLADAVRSKLPGDGLVLLVSQDAGQVSMVMAVTASAAKRVHAGQVLKEISALTQGSGGGRADFAQAGGRDPSKIGQALQHAEGLVRKAFETAS